MKTLDRGSKRLAVPSSLRTVLLTVFGVGGCLGLRTCSGRYSWSIETQFSENISLTIILRYFNALDELKLCPIIYIIKDKRI